MYKDGEQVWFRWEARANGYEKRRGTFLVLRVAEAGGAGSSEDDVSHPQVLELNRGAGRVSGALVEPAEFKANQEFVFTPDAQETLPDAKGVFRVKSVTTLSIEERRYQSVTLEGRRGSVQVSLLERP